MPEFIPVTRKAQHGWTDVFLNVSQILCYKRGKGSSTIYTNAKYSLAFDVQESGDDITAMLKGLE